MMYRCVVTSDGRIFCSFNVEIWLYTKDPLKIFMLVETLDLNRTTLQINKTLTFQNSNCIFFTYFWYEKDQGELFDLTVTGHGNKTSTNILWRWKYECRNTGCFTNSESSVTCSWKYLIYKQNGDDRSNVANKVIYLKQVLLQLLHQERFQRWIQRQKNMLKRWNTLLDVFCIKLLA